MKETLLEWNWGGWFSGGAPPIVWAIFGVVLAVGISLLSLSYLRTLQSLSGGRRSILIGLRSLFWITILLILANPTRLEKDPQKIEPPRKRPLAVALDRSDSMTTPDNRGKTRLDMALKYWAEIEASARESFPETYYYAFSESLGAAASLDEACSHAQLGSQTHLYQSLDELLGRAPLEGFGGVVCLTDGMDTTSATTDQLLQDALASHTPFYFIPSQNRLRPVPYLIVREVKVPSQVRRRSQFEWNALVEAWLAQPQTVPVSLWKGTNCVARASLELTAGRNVVPWSVPLTVDQPGLATYEMHMGEGAWQQSSLATVRVLDQSSVKILYYQGALDWGYRFLADTLRRDPSFKMNALFTPALGIRLTGKGTPDTFTDLPDNAAALKSYHLVILANVFADQLTPAQQNALVSYTREGGGVLFVVPYGGAAQAFAGTKLEEMLPVAFEAVIPQSTRDQASSRFQEAIQRQSRDGVKLLGDIFADQASTRSEQTPLLPFGLTDASRRLPIFASPDKKREVIPSFTTYAAVKSAKPGSEILAIHPTDKGPGGPRILLATESFGRGLSAVLTTDSLWQWKLSLPNTSRDYETFWQQLLLFLAKGPLEEMRFDHIASQYPIQKEVHLKLVGAQGSSPPSVTATSPSGKKLTLLTQATGEAGHWRVPFLPDEAGGWQLLASDEKGTETRAHLRAVASLQSQELSNMPPDLDRLRLLATATGGEMILPGTPPPWIARTEPDLPDLHAEKRRLLWNNWLLLTLCLGIYTAELIWRRRWKLL